MSAPPKLKELSFGDWFHAQFGARETSGATDGQLLATFRAGIDASTEMAKRAEWDSQYKAALYAWATKGEK
jgi:hypothetical protein